MPELATPRPDWSALAERMQSRRDEVDDVLSLLLEHADMAVGPADELRQVSWAMACATLGDGHLWQDMGLPSREALSQLIAHWFPALAARNTQHMRWKKFLYKQLCLREELPICRSPTCEACSEHSVCFGPENTPMVVLAQPGETQRV